MHQKHCTVVETVITGTEAIADVLAVPLGTSHFIINVHGLLLYMEVWRGRSDYIRAKLVMDTEKQGYEQLSITGTVFKPHSCQTVTCIFDEFALIYDWHSMIFFFSLQLSEHSACHLRLSIKIKSR